MAPVARVLFALKPQGLEGPGDLCAGRAADEIVAEALCRGGLSGILAGGAAVELYTFGSYATVDIDGREVDLAAGPVGRSCRSRQMIEEVRAHPSFSRSHARYFSMRRSSAGWRGFLRRRGRRS